jgi:nicotinamidase-related amidase
MSNENPGIALLLIDLQKNMLFGPENPVGLQGVDPPAPGRRPCAAKAPVVLVRNCGGRRSDVKGTPGWELHPAFAPNGRPVLDKTTCDPREHGLDSILRSPERRVWSSPAIRLVRSRDDPGRLSRGYR